MKMKLKIADFVRGQDAFGHPISVNYWGEESFNSILGGLLSMGTMIITLVLTVKAGQEIFAMTEPSLAQYNIPMSDQDRIDNVPLKFDDYSYSLGFVYLIGEKGSDAPWEIGILPPEAG